ncbi:RecB family endonuclease [Wolbachia endosymbiont strain TRS of Brugia malayi]|uniref:YraN family protein n=1 Tax=Wolbachia endosymbiont of Brugia malayi TaxID=80849 RepID=UPI00004C934A|nr:YraN family protein [Wolbachia endosymbiont of Brugia malayi]AAW70905.1 RecB family endonuclease [Wolbachia endosymbiont strain TRS of Brugia malayi]
MVSRLHCFVGYFDELLILLYLKLKWYYVIKYCYCCKFSEIDLIVSKKKELIFIEVKASLLGEDILISYLQYQSIVNSSKYFLSEKLSFLDYPIRYDLCFLSLTKRACLYKKCLA